MLSLTKDTGTTSTDGLAHKIALDTCVILRA